MPAPITLISFFLLVNIITSIFNANQSHARQPTKTSHSLVLGLTHSRTTIKIPEKQSVNDAKVNTPSEMLDMMEPMREVRDGYLISLNLGSPPQIIQVYMDTGSDLTWVPCGNLSFDCIDCNDYRNGKLMSTFSPSSSPSSIRDSCASHFCIDIHSSDNSYDLCIISGCSLSTLVKGTCSRPCPSFAYTYGEGVVSGTLTRDTLRVHGSSQGVTREIPKFCFGCVGSTYREPMGIAGFGKGLLSLPSQLGFLQKGFSHCFLAFKFANNPNISSPLVVGDLAISSKDHLQFTPMLKNPMYPNYYYIGLEAITLGTYDTREVEVEVPSNLRDFDSLGNGGMLIDSGTTYTHLTEPFYSQLLSKFQSVVSYPRATEVEARTGFDLCYRVPCPNSSSSSSVVDDDDHILPSITFYFMNNVSLVLPQGNNFYAMGAPSNATVVKCLLFQSIESGEYGPAMVFGSFQQQNVEVVYDLEKERIGFQPMDCALAAAFQGLHKT